MVSISASSQVSQPDNGELDREDREATCGSASVPQGATLLDLPVELVNEIVMLLDRPDQINLACTSKSFIEPVEVDLWRNVDLVMFENDYCGPVDPNASPVLSCFERALERAEKGWIQLRSALNSRPIREQYIRSISFPITAASASVATEILPRLKNLRVLTDDGADEGISAWSMPTEEDKRAYLTVLSQCGRLSAIEDLQLDLADGSWDDLLSALASVPNLVGLHVGITLPADAPTAAIPSMEHLKSLSLLTTEVSAPFTNLVSRAPCLSQLAILLPWDKQAPKSPISMVVPRSERMQALQLQGYKWDSATNSDDSKMQKVLPRLEKLILDSKHPTLRLLVLNDRCRGPGNAYTRAPKEGHTMPLAKWLVASLQDSPQLARLSPACLHLQFVPAR